eukprot:scaffold76907_cov79-Cyclotella_meneghiniana.AAC.5
MNALLQQYKADFNHSKQANLIITISTSCVPSCMVIGSVPAELKGRFNGETKQPLPAAALGIRPPADETQSRAVAAIEFEREGS